MGSNVYMNGFNPYANPGDDIPNDPGKMFIGGLSWQTTPESIREYFSSFGDLAEVMVMKDPATRRSRGFGFITFSEPTAVEKVLKYPVHQLDGKIVEPKVAVPRKTNPKLVMRTKKIFVGGLSATTSLEDIRAYFEQFSHVQDAMLAYDKITNRHRGFGFVTFDNEDVVDKICEIHFHEINGRMVESKKALPKEPRLSYYSGYSNAYYGGGQGQLSPSGPRNYYGSGFPGANNGFMNGNRYYQNPHFQGFYDRSSNSVERSNSYTNDQQEFSPSSSNGRSQAHFYSKYNNNETRDLYSNGGSSAFPPAAARNNKHHEDHHQRMKQYFNDCTKQADELTNMMLCNYNNHKMDGSSNGGSFSGSGGAYEDDFPELTAAKFSQLRLENSGAGSSGGSAGSTDTIENRGRLSPNVPSNEFCF